MVEGKNVCVKAGQRVGKTNLGGGLINLRYDIFDPGITLWTAPTQNHVEKVLGKEVRRQRRGRPGLMPQAPMIRSAEDHYAVGMTASSGEGFQGQHEASVAIIYDEAIGIDPIYFESGDTMIQGEDSWKVLFYNPTNSASAAYQEETSGAYEIVRLSALDHPNIKAELEGKEPPFPAAVRLNWVDNMVERHCEQIAADHADKTSISWRGKFYKPNGIFEARVLGMWPSTPTESIWSDALFDACLVRKPLIKGAVIVVGVDCARYGNNDTAISIRRGWSLIHAEWANGWGAPRIANQVIWLLNEECRPGENVKQVPIVIDDVGFGGGVSDILLDLGYNVIRVNAGTPANDVLGYPNKRSELWFDLQESAKEGKPDFSRISSEAIQRLRRELMVPKYKPNNQAQRVVEDKEQLRTRLKNSESNSPDLADSVNLCFYTAGPVEVTAVRSGIRSRLDNDGGTF